MSIKVGHVDFTVNQGLWKALCGFCFSSGGLVRLRRSGVAARAWYIAACFMRIQLHWDLIIWIQILLVIHSNVG